MDKLERLLTTAQRLKNDERRDGVTIIVNVGINFTTVTVASDPRKPAQASAENPNDFAPSPDLHNK